MKLFQMMEVQPRKETFRHLAIKLIFVSLPILFVSCKALKIEDETYIIINKVLDSSVEHNGIYLYPKIISKDDYIIRTFNPEAQYYGNCSDSLKQRLFNEQEVNYYKDQHYDFEKWNYAKITSSKVVKQLELKRPESIARYKEIFKTVKDEYDLLDRRFMLWTFEHNEGMIRLSYPFFNKDNTYALVYGSIYQHGSLLWILEKKNKTWEVVCSMELSVY